MSITSSLLPCKVGHMNDKPCWIEDIGSYNDMPSPNELSNQREFLTKLANSHVNEIFRREVDDYIVMVFLFDECGFALQYDFDNRIMNVYRIGCRHEYKDVKIEKNGKTTTETCKCGLVRTWYA